MDLDSAACSTTDLILANVVETCVDDLLQVINLRQQPPLEGTDAEWARALERMSAQTRAQFRVS